MIPGVNPRQMQQMMRQLGMSQEELDATSVIIKLSSGKQLVFDNPNVQKIKMKGEETFQLTGNYEEQIMEEEKLDISDDDIEMVAEQAGVSKDEARKALEETNSDIAKAILNLKSN